MIDEKMNTFTNIDVMNEFYLKQYDKIIEASEDVGEIKHGYGSIKNLDEFSRGFKDISRMMAAVQTQLYGLIFCFYKGDHQRADIDFQYIVNDIACKVKRTYTHVTDYWDEVSKMEKKHGSDDMERK